MAEELDGGINRAALIEATLQHQKLMTEDGPYTQAQQEYRREITQKWDKILAPDNLAKIKGTKDYLAANSSLYYRREPITVEDAKNIIGTASYIESRNDEQPQKWADKFSQEISEASQLVEKMKAGAAPESDLDKTKKPSTVDIPQVTFEEVRDMLKGINPNKYSRGIEINDPATMREINNLVYAMNRKGADSTFDMLKGIIQSNRAAKKS